LNTVDRGYTEPPGVACAEWVRASWKGNLNHIFHLKLPEKSRRCFELLNIGDVETVESLASKACLHLCISQADSGTWYALLGI
jgi:hypothetical protein